MKFKKVSFKNINDDRYNSEQYNLSKKFIELKVKNKLNQIEMATLMNVSFDKYLQMEQCDLNIDLKDYLNAIEKFGNNISLNNKEIPDENLNKVVEFPEYKLTIFERVENLKLVEKVGNEKNITKINVNIVKIQEKLVEPNQFNLTSILNNGMNTKAIDFEFGNKKLSEAS